MSELEYFLSVENIEISLYAQARQSLLLLTQGNIYNRLTFLNKYLMFLEELNEPFQENWSKFLTAGYLVFWKIGIIPLLLLFATLRFSFPSLRNKRFRWVIAPKLEREQKKRGGWERGGRERGGEKKRKRLPANPTILKNAPWYFTVRFICKLTAHQDRNITNRLPLDCYQICKITLFSNRTRCRRLQEL